MVTPAIKWNSTQWKTLLTRISRRLPEILERIFWKLTADALREAQLRAPQNWGHLTNSGFPDVVRVGSKVYGFVGFSIVYAAAMHERFYKLGEKSQEKEAKSDVVVGRKYLERAFKDNADRWLQLLYRDIQEALKK